jgi:hypothetical protein
MNLGKHVLAYRDKVQLLDNGQTYVRQWTDI